MRNFLVSVSLSCGCLCLSWGQTFAQQEVMPPINRNAPGVQVGMLRNGFTIFGELDRAGNFHPFRNVAPLKGNMPYSGPGYRRLNFPLRENEPVYEFRSGRLIKGTLDKEGNFIPALENAVMEYKDYREGKDVPRIYNLPLHLIPKEKFLIPPGAYNLPAGVQMQLIAPDIR